MKNSKYTFLVITSFILGLFILNSIAIAVTSTSSNLPWALFESNCTILGLKLGESTFDEAVNKMGGVRPENPSGKHEVLEIYFRNNEVPQYITFTTGYLHDYSMLYSFKLTRTLEKELLKKCRNYLTSERDIFKTDGGLYLDQSKDDVISILGNPSESKGQTMYWSFKNYKKYEVPKMSFTEAGPTNARYSMKYISNGLYEDGTISIEFIENKTVTINIQYFAESDSKIEHYDLDTGKRIR